MNIDAAPSGSEALSTLEQLLIRYARGFPVQRGKLRVVEALWSRIASRGATRMAVLKYGGLKLPCDLDEMIQRQCYFFGTYFLVQDVLDCWQRLASQAAVVLDIGANVGIFSLAALAANPAAVVHAFEPTPELADGLRGTAALNNLSGLRIHQAAVSRRTGHAVLHRWRGEHGGNGGMNFVTTDPARSAGSTVDAVSLDDFCRRHEIDRIDLMKLDVQGNEHEVLAGAEGLLHAGRIDTVLLELNWAAEVSSPAEEAVRILERNGYRFSPPGRRLRWRAAGPWLRRLEDAVARRARHEAAT